MTRLKWAVSLAVRTGEAMNRAPAHQAAALPSPSRLANRNMPSPEAEMNARSSTLNAPTTPIAPINGTPKIPAKGA